MLLLLLMLLAVVVAGLADAVVRRATVEQGHIVLLLLFFGGELSFARVIVVVRLHVFALTEVGELFHHLMAVRSSDGGGGV